MATAPDVLGVSLYIWNRLCAAQLIRRVKALKPEITVIVGGPEATFSVEARLPFSCPPPLMRLGRTIPFLM